VAIADLLDNLTRLFDGGGFEGRPPRYPPVAVEIAPDRITAVRVADDRKTRQVRLQACAAIDLPAGAIEISLVKPNVLAPEPVTLALQTILEDIAPGEHRVSLLLPDDVARATILPFATLPRTRRELVDLVRFRTAKSLPFKLEDATLDLNVVSGAPGQAAGPGGAAVLAVFAHRAVIEQYESLMRACGLWPGLVGLSTFELFNLFRPRLEEVRDPARDALFLNATRQYLSLLIFRDRELIFYRCKPYSGPGGPGDGLVELRREIYTSLAFYQEKLLGRGVGTCWVRAAGLDRGQVAEAVGAESGGPVVFLEPGQVLPSAPAVRLDPRDAALFAPAAGAAAGRRA
jgi:hypothetical protein